jgi:hypothetical protein
LVGGRAPIVLFKDGIQIEKESDKDQFYVDSGDLELIGSVLEAALRMR